MHAGASVQACIVVYLRREKEKKISLGKFCLQKAPRKVVYTRIFQRLARKVDRRKVKGMAICKRISILDFAAREPCAVCVCMCVRVPAEEKQITGNK